MQQGNPYKAYSKANHTVPKTQQVVMLYDGVIRNLKQAKQAVQENDIQTRFNRLKRSSDIIIGLQLSLDFNQGEEAARALYDFYASIDSRIMQQHRKPDASALDLLIEEVKQMRDLWAQIDRGEIDSNGALQQLQPSAAATPSVASQQPVATSAPANPYAQPASTQSTNGHAKPSAAENKVSESTTAEKNLTFSA